MAPTARELLQRREDERRVDDLRAALTSLRGAAVHQDEDVLTEWSRAELVGIGRSGSTPDASIEDGPDPAGWLTGLAARAELGDRLFLGTGQRCAPWLDCEVLAPDWVAEAWPRLGGNLRAVSADRRRLLVVFDEEHAVEAFVRAAPAGG